MEKKFSEVVVGEKFTVNGIEYTKTEDVRVSCCQVINCYATANVNQKSFFQGDTVVTTNG